MRLMTITALTLVLFAGGCERPSIPSLDGPGMLHDINAVHKDMSPNEVRRVMGGKFETVYEEGIQGMDGGNYIWQYAQGRVYFNLNGVTRVVPN